MLTPMLTATLMPTLTPIAVHQKGASIVSSSCMSSSKAELSTALEN